MRVVLTNDDGIDAPGIAALYTAIAGLGEIHVIAPAGVRSASGHAVTFHRPIPTTRRIITDTRDRKILEGIAVDGSPADCVKLAAAHLVPTPGKIDLVVSGMNAGANVGVNVNYSGTVAAAREAAIMGIPAIAVSLHVGDPRKIDWPRAAAHARRVIDQLLAGPIAPYTVLNVNVPILDDGREPKGLRVVPTSPSPLVDRYLADDGGLPDRVFRAVDGFIFHQTPDGTDVSALFDGYITLTPLDFDPTHRPQLRAWSEHLGSPAS